MILVLLMVASYLLGSIPTGYWLVKGLKGIDIRQVGSGSTGTTNVLRSAGRGAAAIVFLVDIGKGVLPVRVAVWVAGAHMLAPLPSELTDWAPFMVALSALIGHSKSIFLNFQGGKSAATGLGTIIAMNWLTGSSMLLLWAAIIFATRLVSLASIIAAASSVVFMYLFGGQGSYIAYCFLGAAYVIIRHKSNIKRLLSGTEPKIGQKADLGKASERQQVDVPEEAAGPTAGNM